MVKNKIQKVFHLISYLRHKIYPFTIWADFLKENTIVGISNINKKNLPMLHFIGGGNRIKIGNCKLSHNLQIYIKGHNNHIEISDNVVIQGGLLYLEDSNNSIFIGRGTTIGNAEIAVAEYGTSISIGEDCMLSKGIRIVTTDSHSVLDTKTGKRLNPAKDVIIEKHVWVGMNVAINKGCKKGSNSIIAGNSVVTHDVPENVIVAGCPAKVVKSNITWSRNRL